MPTRSKTSTFPKTRCLPIAIASALILLITLVTPVAARALHAQYDHSNPPSNARLPSGQPPESVEIWFTEQIEPAFSSIQVYDKNKQRVDKNDSHGVAHDPYALIVSLHPHLPDGAYTVVFSNVSAEDGHHVKSNFSFVVGAGPLPSNTNALLDSSSSLDENFNAWSITLRWLNYLGMASLVGVVAFLLLVWRPCMQLANQALNPEAISKARHLLEKRASRLLFIGILALLVGWVTFLIYQTCIDSGRTVWTLFGSQALNATLFQSHFGIVWLMRLVLIVCTILCWLYWSRRRASAQTGDKKAQWQLWLLLLLGTGIMVTTSLNSHAAASKDAWFLLPTDIIHLLSAGFWIGGLVMLVSGLPAVWQVLLPGTGERTRFLAILIPRFSRVAIISVALLALTGILQAFIQLGSINALFSTNYGLALCIKIGLFAILLCLGAYNLLRVSPRMRRFAGSSGVEEANSFAAGSLQRAFRRAVGVEAGLVILVLLVVGGLTSLSPPPQQQSAGASSQGAFVRQGQAGNLNYNLVMNPGKVGINTFEVDLHEPSGKPITGAEAVILRFTMLDMDMGVQDVQLQPVAGTPGRYSGTANVVSMSGHWRILLLVRRTGYDDVRVILPYTAP